ncbi:hypothetical protein Halru_0841 [Halovivax ruber XH-70]|uniref:CARDB domain-containing protein n=1 Tax=Halovivax ruber (strain DSM 18193 / JCM 13892 / XH-70) TaxID=797302 RepID=L0I7C5_HALRX|nr:hypothetical protein [Halovivax ruber]AGB15465.1 hypothetical protein Halru_0841 [Halovivax ruber XH-70]
MDRRTLLAGAASFGVAGCIATPRGAQSELATDQTGLRITSGSHDPGPDAVVGVNDSITATATAVDPEGRLDTIEWIDGRNVLVFQTDDVSGTEATSTVSFDEVPKWLRAGYPTMVRATTTDGRETARVDIEGPAVRRPYAVDIVDTTMPLSGGDRFDATISVEDVGDLQHVGPSEQEIRLRVGGDRTTVDRTTVDLGYGQSTTIVLGYDTYPVQQAVEFPVRAEGPDDADEIDIRVGPAADTTPPEQDLRVSITDVDDDGVRGGETLEITAEFENTGDTRINTVAQLVSVGKGAVVNEAQVVLDPGETQELVFAYKTYPVKTDVEFEMAVCTPYGSDTVTVSVAAAGSDPDRDGPFGVAIFQVNDPVAGGDRLEVAASFVNSGDDRGSFTAELVVGDEVVDTREIEMAGQSTVIRTLGYDTYPVTNDVTFPVTVRTPDDSATTQVEVFGTDHEGPVTASITGTTAPVTGGERLDVSATVTNDGTATTDAVVELVVGGEVVDAKTVSLGAGSSQSITLGYDTYPVKNDSTFEVTVRTADGSVATPVTVYGTEGDGADESSKSGDESGSEDGGSDDGDDSDGGSASFGVSIDGTNAPVDGGDRLDISTTITNAGDADGSATASLVVGGETVASRGVSVPAGGSQPVTLGYSTYPVQQDVTFPVTVRVDGASASTSVSVRGVSGSESDAENGEGSDDSADSGSTDGGSDGTTGESAGATDGTSDGNASGSSGGESDGTDPANGGSTDSGDGGGTSDDSDSGSSQGADDGASDGTDDGDGESGSGDTSGANGGSTDEGGETGSSSSDTGVDEDDATGTDSSTGGNESG